MNGSRDEFREPREIWRRVKIAAPAAPPPVCPGPGELAAYLDEACRADARDAIEEHLQRCPACVGAVVELRRLLRDGPAPAPAAVFERAKGLVAQSETNEQGVGRFAPLRGVFGLMQTSAAWAAAAALVVAACAAGFVMGRETFPEASAQASKGAANPVLVEFNRLEQQFLRGDIT